MSKILNTNQHRAKKEKQDEFYTQLSDIEKELVNYKKHFKNKTVYCNCDDPRVSNFFHYFSYNFEKLKLKKLISTCYKSQNVDLFSQNDSEKAVYLEYNGDKNNNKIPDAEEIGIKHLNDDGDFRSEESINLLKQSDIVVTNPPFSKFREFIGQLMENKKKFIILGNKGAVGYKDIFKWIKNNKLWIGSTPMGADMLFGVPEDIEKKLTKEGKVGSRYKLVDGKVMARAPVAWFTNIDIKKRHETLLLYKKYSSHEFPKYVNYDAIEVSKTADIPINYKGKMGVPLTFLDKYNPDQFEIIGMANDKREKHEALVQGKQVYLDDQHKKFVGMVLKKGKKLVATYTRILIKHKKL
tara:strand:- start:573 stop:1631 length:1059 start_codon:yes stop_codon:yes gene_type:complete